MKQAKPVRKFNLVLISLVMFNFLPHIGEQSPLVFLFAFFCLGWRLFYEYQKVKLPGKILKSVLVFASAGMVMQLYGGFDGLEAVTAVLLCATALKMLDNVNYRDAMVLLFVNFMVLMSAFLIDQSLLLTVFGTLDLILISSLLFQLHKAKDLEFNIWSMIKLGAKLCAMTLPLLLILFFVFPRFSMGIFNKKSQAENSSGFSDNLEPGGVNQLVLDDSIAFRAYFSDSKIPKSSEMYWRGVSFKTTEGLKWTGKPEFKQYKRRYFNAAQEDLEASYKVILEPNYGKWLFLLDPHKRIRFPHWRYYQNLEEGDEGSLRLKNSVAQNVMYDAFRFDEVQTEDVNTVDYLQLPQELSPELKSLSEKLGGVGVGAELFARNASIYFASNFRYSLSLEGKESNSLDEFLFKNKMGFCEHFAGSFAFLARMSGIPSRVVAGFQGGRKHPFADYVIVSNRDAHAWVELYDQDTNQWKRFDPTGFVAPLRLELGGQMFHSVPASQASNIKDAQSFLELAQNDLLRNYFQSLSLAIDIVQERWNYFLLNYDYEQQKEILKSLGINIQKKSQLAWGALIGFIVFLIWLRRRQIRSFSEKLNPVQEMVLKHKKELSRLGYQKLSHQGYGHFYKELAREAGLKEVSDSYRSALEMFLYGEREFGEKQKADFLQKFKDLKNKILEEKKKK